MDRVAKIVTQFYALTLKLIGVLSKDLDVRDIPVGGFVDALNTRSITDTGQSTNSRQNIIGSELAWKLKPIALQSKIFRVYLKPNTEVTFPVISYLTINTPNNTLAIAATGHLLALSTAPQIYNLIATAIGAQWAAQSYVLGAFVATGTTGYFDLEFSTVPYWNYQIQVDSRIREKDAITIQESYDQTLIGDWNCIGSWSIQRELISWWTTQRNLPLDLDIDTITDNGIGRFRIKTTVNHGMASNEKVIVKNCTAATTINGEWIITVVSLDEFDLNGSVFGSVTKVGFVTQDPQGIGELGRAVKNEQTKVWNYTRLIRAKALNWVTKHQQDTLCKKDALRKTYRYTDDYNPVGTLYDRTINYVDDCLLTFVDPRNTYSYENIGLESQFIQSGTDATLTVLPQTQSGGNILSGNSRFSFVLETDSLVATTPSPLTNPVPAARSSETGAPTSWSGDAAGVLTPKIDNLLLEGSLVDNYKWARLLVVNYQDDAVTGFKLPRVLITSNSMQLRWTGFEATEDLDVGTLQELTFGYKTALSIDELDGRVILSNLTSSVSYDLTDFAQSLTYSVLRKELDSIGSRYNGTLSINEYEKSRNVNEFAGLEINETYRIGIEADFIDGGTSLIYHSFDAKIDNLLYPRRLAALPDLNLTDITASKVYVPYLQISGINWDFILPTGQRLRDVVRRLRVLRVERDDSNREIWSGIAIYGVVTNLTEIGIDIPTTATGTYTNGNLTLGAVGTDNIGEFCLVEGNVFDPLSHNFFTARLGTPKPDRFAVYASDFLYGESSWNPTNSDKIINFSQPNYISPFPVAVGHTPPDNAMMNNMAEYTGYTTPAPVTLDVAEGSNLDFGATGTLGGQTFSKVLAVTYFTITPSPYNFAMLVSFPSSPIARTTTGFSVIPASGDHGIRRIQVYRPKTDKFGDPTLSKYVTTGAELSDKTATTIDVFGGDVFTQKTWIRHRMVGSFAQSTPTFGVAGFGGGIAYYSQSRVNTDMTDRNNSPTEYKYPFVSEATWLNTLTTANPFPSYNQGYNLKNLIQSYAAYNPDQSLVASDFPVRFIWGQKAQPEQASDSQRNFLPLDFYDAQYRYGEVIHHRVANGELYSWQENKFQRYYFNSNALINTSGGAEIILGSGAVMSRRPIEITNYGCPNKWAISKGLSATGDTTFYWYNPIAANFIRFGGDGTTNQGVIKGLSSWLSNHSSMVVGKDTPADGQGICCVWNDEFKESIFTVRAWKDGIEDWDAGDNYVVGSEVIFGTAGFEKIPQIYVSKTINSVKQPNLNPDDWRKIDITDPLYYNVYSFIFSEYRFGFDGFVSFKPKIYLQHENFILSPRPISNTGEVYEHNRGLACVWYDNGNTSQTEDGLTRIVFNADPVSTKEFHAIRMWTDIVPFHVNFKTAEHESYLDAVDFDEQEGKFDSSIKADSTVTLVDSPFGSVANPTGSNELDTTAPIYGSYLEIELIFQAGVEQKWYGITVKGQLSDRKNKS